MYDHKVSDEEYVLSKSVRDQKGFNQKKKDNELDQKR